MGNFYTNITVLRKSALDAVWVLHQLNREAFVADTGGACVVYDRDSEGQDGSVLSALAEHIAAELQTTAFAVMNQDDDVLWFQLFDRTDLLTEHANVAGAPTASASILCRAFNRLSSTLRVWFLLRRPFVFQVKRHEKLAAVLGLPDASVGFGFNYIERGELPQGLPDEKIHRVQRHAL